MANFKHNPRFVTQHQLINDVRKRETTVYEHYRSKTVSSEELDQLIARAEAEKARNHAFASIIVADYIENEEDEEIDSWLMCLLDLLCEPDIDERRSCPSVIGQDVIAATDELGLTLGTVYDAPDREERVIELDTEAESDAQAWATMAALPDWLTWRYRKLVRAGVAAGHAAA